MKIVKRTCSAAISTVLFALSFNAAASQCTWSTSGFSVSYVDPSVTTTFACKTGNTLLANKTVTTFATGAQSCSLQIVASGYVNKGTCESPNITAQTSLPPPPTYTSGQKVCEFNDPVTGTTPGCTSRQVGGYNNTAYYDVRKDNVSLISVSIEFIANNNCRFSGNVNSDYYVVGSGCSNYRIYKK